MAVIYESTNKTGILDIVYFNTGADTVSYPLGILMSYINAGVGEIISNILKVDKRWKWDDANISESLETTFSLSDGIGEYGILGAAPAQTYQDFSRLFGVAVKDANGTWVELEYIDREIVAKLGIPWDEFYSDDGNPRYYMPEGTQLFLKPAPNYDSASGAKLYVQRNPEYFIYNDTTKVPPFDSKFHLDLALWGELGWNLKNDKGAVPLTRSLIEKVLKNIRAEYAMRLQDRSPEYFDPKWK